MKKGDYLIAYSVSVLTFTLSIFHNILDEIVKKKCILLVIDEELDSRNNWQRVNMGYFAYSTFWFFGNAIFIEDESENRKLSELKQLVTERKEEFGLSDEEIEVMDAEDLELILS